MASLAISTSLICVHWPSHTPPHALLLHLIATHMRTLEPADNKPTGMAPSFDFKRHERFWFDDGNIILVAGDVGFKIFRGLLAAHSAIFADMLVSSSASKDEVHDGCPLVSLSETPQELAHFLTVFIPTPGKL